jgi:hypothetical protein
MSRGRDVRAVGHKCAVRGYGTLEPPVIEVNPVPLIPCETCRRHVRDRDEACPFCRTRLKSRAVLVAAIGVALGACQADEPQRPDPVTPQGATTSVEVAPVTLPPPEPANTVSTVPTVEVDPFSSAYPGPAVGSAATAPPVVSTLPPTFDRPMVARYGIAPRPRPKSP